MTETNEAKQPARLTRDELYRAVWATPMSRLAQQYGITGNGLAKICDRLKVPYPPRGYWAKVSAGKRTVRFQLPEPEEATPRDVLIHPTPPPVAPAISEELHATLERAQSEAAQAKVPLRLAKPHPVIANWLAERKRELQEARLDRDPYRNRMFAPKPFTVAERRHHRFLDTLFKELERHGAKISEEERGSLHAKLQGEKIEFQLREKLKRIRRPLTDEENRWEWNRKRGYVQELQPTGNLVFAIKTYLGNGLHSQWLESSSRSIEDLLPEIVAGFLTAAPFLAECTRKREDERRQYEEEQRRRYEREQQEKLVSNRLRKFVEFAEQWRDTNLARDFLGRLRSRQIDVERVFGDKTMLQWFDWMEANLQKLDPIEQGAIAIFSDVAEVDTWTYDD